MHANKNSFIIDAKWLIPVVPEGTVLEDNSLVISNNLIIDICPHQQAHDNYPHLAIEDLTQHAVMPGLINTHGHAAMTLLRGYADDKALMEWLENYIWPIESTLVSYDFVYDGTLLAIAEMISSGTTCTADSYFFPDAVAAAFHDQKFRAQVACPVVQFPTNWANDEEEHISKAMLFYEQYKQHQHIYPAIAPHAPYSVSDRGFEQIAKHSKAHKIPVHLHLHETVGELQTESGQRPLQRIYDHGLFNSLLQTVHMTQLNDAEIQLLAANQVHVAHCPDSNLKLASGFCPVDKLRHKGVNVAVGTDGAASNNNLDMLAEIRSAALLSKGVTLDPTSISAAQALSMGTINGAKLLGIEDQVGSLEIGKQADVIAIDMSSFELQPVHNPISQIVYSANGNHVSDVWINGQQLLKHRKLTQLDTTALTDKVNMWRQSIRQIST
jgi:5-methylthioadenosine/S-adenosylhomocysteine deaminase